jgi:hypothetical protein
MMRRSVRAMALVVVLLLGSTIGAGASSNPPWSRGYAPDGYAPYVEEGPNRCIIRTKLWLMAHAGSGITQLQVRFQLRAPQDPGVPYTHYGDTGWVGSGYFDSSANRYMYFWSWFNPPPGGLYKVTASYRGVRPGFWNRDLRFSEDLEPNVGCDIGATWGF